MKFQCNVEYFEKALEEEFTVIAMIPYGWVWVQVQFFSFFGILFPKARSTSEFIKEKWNAKVEVVSSEAMRQYAMYNLLRVIGLHWLVCETIMYKYFIFHPISLFIPPINPLAALTG